METLEGKLERLITTYVDACTNGCGNVEELNAIANLTRALVELKNSY